MCLHVWIVSVCMLVPDLWGGRGWLLLLCFENMCCRSQRILTRHIRNSQDLSRQALFRREELVAGRRIAAARLQFCQLTQAPT
jgi:hypothetical protein